MSDQLSNLERRLAAREAVRLLAWRRRWRKVRRWAYFASAVAAGVWLALFIAFNFFISVRRF
jgi:hypothetical protein